MTVKDLFAKLKTANEVGKQVMKLFVIKVQTTRASKGVGEFTTYQALRTWAKDEYNEPWFNALEKASSVAELKFLGNGCWELETTVELDSYWSALLSDDEKSKKFKLFLTVSMNDLVG